MMPPLEDPPGIIESMMAYEKLDAWKVSHELALAIYRSTDAPGTSKAQNLIHQLRDTAILAPAKLAHASVRRRSDKIQYIDLALGLLSELSYNLRMARELRLLSHHRWVELHALRGRAVFYTQKLLFSVLSGPGETR
jgi:four helix bundle protein